MTDRPLTLGSLRYLSDASVRHPSLLRCPEGTQDKGRTLRGAHAVVFPGTFAPCEAPMQRADRPKLLTFHTSPHPVRAQAEEQR
jgi:hypothetical protein